MKVLILHQHFRTPYEGGAIRSYYLGQALIQHGYQVTVITGYNGPHDKVEMIDGMEVHYLRIPYQNYFGFYRRSIAFVQFIRKSIQTALKLKGIDFCYAMSVPLTVGVAGRSIAAKFKVPLIFEVGDLWPDAPIQMGYLKANWLKNYLLKLERTIYESSDKIVALSVPIAERVRSKVGEGKKIPVIPNMSDTEFFTPTSKDSNLEAKYGVGGKFVITYAGAVGVANGLEHIVNCAYHSQDAKLAVHFIICGEGGELEKIKQLARQKQLSNISFAGMLNREGVREVLNVTDACFVSYASYPILETGSPNKYFDALAAGKLVIVNFSGWIREEVEKSKCGIFVGRNSPNQFVYLITSFIHSSKLAEYQSSARSLAETKYSRQLLGAKFASIFQNIR